MDLFRIGVIVMLFAIIGSLGSALFSLSRSHANPDHSRRMVRALTLRVGLSVGLFLLLLVAWWLGYIQPNQIQ
jgi:Protein of unknown function (DUF2909)